jgi:hypothetical protein
LQIISRKSEPNLASAAKKDYQRIYVEDRYHHP